MKKMNAQKVAVSVGLFIGSWHLLWSVLILIGLAQPLINFIFWLHMLSIPYQVTGFSLTQSVLLVLITFGVGYIGGWVFAWLWNTMHK